MGSKAQCLLGEDTGRICGVATRDPDGNKDEIRADLVVACDGRDSALRAQMMQSANGPAANKLALEESGAPIAVLWFRLPRRAGDAEELLGRLASRRAMVLIKPGDYFLRRGTREVGTRGC